MVKQEEQIKYNNMKSKYERTQAKNDILEQENIELKKQLKAQAKLITALENSNKNLQQQFDEKCNNLFDEIAKVNEEIQALNAKKKEDSKTIKKLQNKVDSLKVTIENLKANKIKDSSNSSKPSSTNGFKKVIQNNRVKSDKAKGGQKGRVGKTLNEIEKPDEIIDIYGKQICDCGGNIVYSCEYIKKQLIDLLNEVKTFEYRYHIGKCEKCGKEYTQDIPKELANPVQYSKKIKSLVPVIKNMTNISVETTQTLFATLFNGFKPSIGWIHSQDKIVAKKSEPVLNQITEYLKLAPYAHVDETFLKIAEALGCCLAFSNKHAVLYGMFKNKSKDSFDEFGMFNEFCGILSHDHNKTYYMYECIKHAECNVHISRYLKYFIDLFNRDSTKKFKEFLMGIYKEKVEAITNNKTALSQDRINEIENTYLELLDEWENEYNEAIQNLKKLSKDYSKEKNLFTRLREYKEEHLRFIKDFTVPFSNNEAERNLRSIKIKMNVSKRFGTLECARNYATIKSIIETAKKQELNILEVFGKILDGNYDVFKLSY